MKRGMWFVLALLQGFTMLACAEPSEQTTIAPDISGLSVSEAKLLINGQFRINEVLLPTNEYLPDIVVDYTSGKKAGDAIPIGAFIDVLVSAVPTNSYTYSQNIQYVSEIGFITGPNSLNYDVLRESGIGGTDLGIPVKVGDEMILLYGDSFSGVGSHSGLWFSNFIAKSVDKTLWDGLEFSSVVTNSSGIALPFMQGLHHQNTSDENSTNPLREVTKIPTGGITIGNTTYVFYMSVRYWGVAGAWLVTYNQAIKSTDLVNWENVDGLVWYENEAPNFGQIFPFEDPNDPNTIYFTSIPGGRFGGLVLFKVAKDHFEDRSQYEYYIGNDTWMKGDAGLLALKNDVAYIIGPACSEMSIMYNQYLGQWIAVYLKGSQIVMQTADTLTGPWSKTEAITNSTKYPGLYGGFVHPEYTTYDGKKFYIQVSMWLPVYQTVLVEVVLK